MSSRPNHDVDVAIWPDIWSAGQVCAFSGLDGPTHWTSAVGGRTLADQCGFLFDTQPSIKLILRATIDGQPVLDVFDPLAVPRCRIAAAGLELALPLATGGEVLVRLAFDAGERLIGRVTVGGGTVAHRLAMFLELQSNETSLIAPSRLVTPGRQLASSFRPAALQRALPSDGVAAALADPQRFEAAAESYDGRPESWSSLARVDLPVPVGETAEASFALVFDRDGEAPESAPAGAADEPLLMPAPPPPDGLAGLSPAILRCRAKAIAILRANCFAPEGSFSRHWIVPQRTKHRNFNTFHAPFLALGALHFDPAWRGISCARRWGSSRPTGWSPSRPGRRGSRPTPAAAAVLGYWQVYHALQIGRCWRSICRGSRTMSSTPSPPGCWSDSATPAPAARGS